ncbi:MAG: hypothetical protein HYR85_08335 [Planctomycetes bacterium]|nr:hypothetical protein [Planctomycetota bacterium]MBI3845300.1 hypothetical protein [Planctomycetota bacterium]
MSKVLLAAFMLALIIPLNSCASILTGSTDTISLLTNPPGAQFSVNNGAAGTTPATITVRDDETVTVQFAKTGYQSREVTLRPGAYGWGLWGLFGDGLLGFVPVAISSTVAGFLIGSGVMIILVVADTQIIGHECDHQSEVRIDLAPVDGESATNFPQPR